VGDSAWISGLCCFEVALWEELAILYKSIVFSKPAVSISFHHVAKQNKKQVFDCTPFAQDDNRFGFAK
jgi:hypothetical protein